jgi:hypothetical protein
MVKKKVVFLLFIIFGFFSFGQNHRFYIDEKAPVLIEPKYFTSIPQGGDTLFVQPARTQSIIFKGFFGNEKQPIVISNNGGQVNIQSTQNWSALELKNCRYIKISGKGKKDLMYGFKLAALNCGVSFNTNSSDCEIVNVEIDHRGFFGIVVKDDYSGNPPIPVPVFEKLVIHDCLIKNVSEGMYLGETLTPGMEFKHVRIFNNICFNTGREGIQIANMIDDVEVYNNTIINAGLSKEHSQGNGIQIGDNTVGNFYNNIIQNSFENGLIVFGSGDIRIHDNYLENGHGIFIDNRTVTKDSAEISVSDNYFYNLTDGTVVVVYNELNPITLLNNHWNGTAEFLSEIVPKNPNLTSENNRENSFLPLKLINPAQGDFKQSASNPKEFAQFGIQPNLSYQFNYTPEIEAVGNIYLNYETDTTIIFKASTLDNDPIIFSISSLPQFASFVTENGNRAKLRLTPRKEDVGIYHIMLTAADQSRGAKNRQFFQIAIKKPGNSPPTFSINQPIQIESLTRQSILITSFDMDNDPVTIQGENLPSFAKIRKSEGVFYLDLNPGFLDSGTFDNVFLSANDGYNLPVQQRITIIVTPKILKSEMPIYRINCGGPELVDSPINWQGDYYQKMSYEFSDNFSTGSHGWNGINTTSAPDSLFGPWCFTRFPDTMKWSFPCLNGDYLVNLFFAEQKQDVTSKGPAVFSIFIEDSKVANRFSIFKEAGYKALKKTYFVSVNDSQLDLELAPIQNELKLNGIEIIFVRSQTILDSTNFKSNYRIFPNPMKNWFYLQSKDSTLNGNYQFEIYDLMGRLLSNFDVEANDSKMMRVEFDVYPRTEGHFLLKIANGSKKPEVSRIVIID